MELNIYNFRDIFNAIFIFIFLEKKAFVLWCIKTTRNKFYFNFHKNNMETPKRCIKSLYLCDSCFTPLYTYLEPDSNIRFRLMPIWISNYNGYNSLFYTLHATKFYARRRFSIRTWVKMSSIYKRQIDFIRDMGPFHSENDLSEMKTIE